MNPLISILRFLYRIRYWLLFAPTLTTILVYYFTSNLPATFEASTTIYTGISSAPDINGDVSSSKSSASSAFDNIIYLVHSRSALERISLRLLARTLVHGSKTKDNSFINSEHYSELLSIIPQDVKQLVNNSSEKETFEKLLGYNEETKSNFLFNLLNWSDPYFSISALSKTDVHRLGNSDMIEIKYRNNDPGIAYQTMDILNEELISEFSSFQLGSSNSVIEYFEEQLDSIRSQLKTQEDSLVEFSKSKSIVNYDMQSQMMVERLNNFETQFSEVSMTYATSNQMVTNMENRLAKRAYIMKNNQAFLQTLGTVSLFSKKIANIELSSSNGEIDAEGAGRLPIYREALSKSEAQLYDIANNITETLYTKDGAVLNDLMKEWLAEILISEKAKAEMAILEKKKEELKNDYFQYSPVGPELKRQEREISITEDSYHALIDHLAQAKLQQKNFQMKSSNLYVISPPVYPISFVESMRKSLVILAFVGSLVFILSCFLILEILDKTVRDKYRATALSQVPVLGAFPGPLLLKHRSFAKEIDRIAADYVCNRLMYLHEPGKTNVINLISKEAKEGRSKIAENMKSHWEEQHFKVQVISYHTDFNAKDKEYFKASSIKELSDWGSNAPDFIIVEHAPIIQQSINKAILSEAIANLYIVRTNRAWTESDQLMFNDIQSHGTTTFLLLSKAKLFAVEDFTGILPNASKLKKWAYKLMQLELSSEKDQNLET
jgi:uncharacterized protein involved in exopolysaccharide biosynthesis